MIPHLVGRFAVIGLTLLNAFYFYGTGRRLYKFDQDAWGRWGDMLIMGYILAQEVTFALLW